MSFAVFRRNLPAFAIVCGRLSSFALVDFEIDHMNLWKAFDNVTL